MDYTEKLERIILELLDELEAEHLGASETMRDDILSDYGIDVYELRNKYKE